MRTIRLLVGQYNYIFSSSIEEYWEQRHAVKLNPTKCLKGCPKDAKFPVEVKFGGHISLEKVPVCSGGRLHTGISDRVKARTARTPAALLVLGIVCDIHKRDGG